MDTIPKNIFDFEVGITSVTMEASTTVIIIFSVILSLIRSTGSNERICRGGNGQIYIPLLVLGDFAIFQAAKSFFLVEYFPH